MSLNTRQRQAADRLLLAGYWPCPINTAAGMLYAQKKPLGFDFIENAELLGIISPLNEDPKQLLDLRFSGGLPAGHATVQVSGPPLDPLDYSEWTARLIRMMLELSEFQPSKPEGNLLGQATLIRFLTDNGYKIEREGERRIGTKLIEYHEKKDPVLLSIRPSADPSDESVSVSLYTEDEMTRKSIKITVESVAMFELNHLGLIRRMLLTWLIDETR